MQQETYIWINEAVKVYDKTRQTFYNYINKNQIKTKKVKNKLYLLERDIMHLIQDINNQSWNLFETILETTKKESIQTPHSPKIIGDIEDDNKTIEFTPTAYLVWEWMSKELETRLDLIDDFLVTLQEEQQNTYTLLQNTEKKIETTNHHDQQALIHLIQNNQKNIMIHLHELDWISKKISQKIVTTTQQNKLYKILIVTVVIYTCIMIFRLVLLY
jgi:hypothetical protein